MKQILTSNGMNLILRGLAGSTIEFTKIKFGNGEEQGVTAVDLSNPIMEVLISSITRDTNFITLGASYKNAEVPSEFSAHEIGVFAKDPDDDTKEILYCFWYEEDPVKADYISPVEDRILETKVEFLVFVDTVENVTAVMADSTEFATKVALNQHTENYTNPHRVTKTQVGLGNVPNVTPENQRPLFSSEFGPIIVTTTQDAVSGTAIKKTSFDNIVPGETMGAILRKIRTAFSVLLSHLSSGNPHYITPKLIGAAATTHYHNASAINSGTLGIARGGTGGNTAYEARCSLGIQAGVGGITGTKGEEIIREYNFLKEFRSAPIVVLTPTTDMHSADVYLSVYSVSTTGFSVRIYSETLSPVINFNWIAVE